MTLRIPPTGVAIAAAVTVLLAGCAAQHAPSAGAGPAPAPAPAPAAPVADTIARKGPAAMTYGEITQTVSDGAAKAKKALVGKVVALNLTKASTKGLPAGLYEVQADDDTYFRCKASASGFKGGEVTAKVSNYSFTQKTNRSVVELDRCAVTVAEASAPVVAAAPAPAAAPASAPAVAKGGAKPGMDSQGNVIDSTKVEAGSGRTVKGMNDYEGEITGNPARNSKFTQLQIGMSWKQVVDLAGEPTDSGAYMTGKAWIPFYFGGDRHRLEMTYKGQGRLIFAGGSLGNVSGGNLIWIIHNPNETGYR
ncbi:hypothetical protein QTI24_23710 [Variovorax sp. J22P240]|uniref:hypothetical protein n=1 Tax=Variovorax sp. J22P240 TaxID=3053514 RepID=UPI002575BE02|nr:hypothetical protein [Variovorax sp. J22P240]MDM0001633.1 hypothetical protein [Variovorax sp. J22P240]